MDLVDIDKVLNDLELNENKNPSNIKLNCNNQIQNDQINQIIENPIDKQSEQITNINNDNNKIDNNIKCTNELDRNKRFVAVSQVLSSLDDYCRDVNTLKINLNNDDNNINQSEQKIQLNNIPTTVLIPNNTVSKLLSINNTNNDNYSILINDKNNINNIDNNYINKSYNNDYNNDEQLLHDNDYLTNSSITTSSPSSFSSGPSPCCGDDICDLSINESNEYKKYEMIDDNNDDKIQQSLTLKIQSNINDNNDLTLTSSSSIINNINNKNNDTNKLNNTNDISSSISSCLYNDNTLSSLPEDGFIKNYDYDEHNLSTSSKLLSMTSNDYDNVQNDKINIIKSNDNQIDLNNKIDDIIQINDKDNQIDKVNVVTFGSTMDEISDTELDSMLQEIDIELQNQQQNINLPDITNINENNLNIKIPISEDDESISSIGEITISSSSSILGYNLAGDSCVSGSIGTGIITSTSTISHNCPDIPNTILSTISSDNCNQNSNNDNNLSKNLITNDLQQNQQHEIDDNLQNADSFSQASTIEFIDLRLQNDFGNYKNDNNINDGLTISNNSIKNINDKIIKINNDLITDNINEIDNKLINQSEQQQLQRPNSLDLPNQNYITSATTSTNESININSTAGQTPPAKSIDNTILTESINHITNEELLPSIELLDNHNDTDNINNSIGNLSIETTTSSSSTSSSSSITVSQLGKIPPFWIPDNETNLCMQCKLKFTLLKRRHHCRACGQVLCSVCCSKKSKLQFLGDNEVRICIQCHLILNKQRKKIKNDKEIIVQHQQQQQQQQRTSDDSISDDDDDDDNDDDIDEDDINASALLPNTLTTDGNINNNNNIRSPNPNNPMEYCSMIPPYQQVERQNSNQNNIQQNPISVMVPVGVLKREGVLPKNPRKDKNVIFSDGIRPGCDLADLDNNWDDVKSVTNRKFGGRVPTPTGSNSSTNNRPRNRNKPLMIQDENDSFIPKKLDGLPPIYCKTKTDYEYKDVENNVQLIEKLKNEMLKFVIQTNFYVYVKIVTLKCCINKTIINFTTFGMHHVGQDEIIILLEINNKLNNIPKDIFIHLNEIYRDADRGQPITELGFSMPKQQKFLGSREHGGFLYIRSTFQCLQEIYIPESPFLIGILIHRWEVPWAKIFPLRLMLRLGAQYRYYPSPHISICERNSVYAEIAQTIINFLADFRNYSYTLATIKGMYIHMEDRKTSILIPKNRYDQIIKAINNSSDHILALGGNFSKKADGHLVCIQNMESNCADTHTYSTQAINIQGQPRKVTGASFIVLNGALKTTSGLSGKCSIVEDGLMVQILPTKMQSIRTLLKNMKDTDIICGPIDADETQTEIVSIKWTDNDTEFNIGVVSPIDGKKMNGIPSIRVHSGFNYSNTNHIIRWTEVFIIQSGDESPSHGKEPLDISKLSEQIARSASMALSSFLDLLAANGYIKIGLRVTLNQENVCFEAGSKNTKLAPLYMNALDNELIPILHKETNLLEVDVPIIAELIFHILDK